MYRNVKKKLKNVNICYGTIPVAGSDTFFRLCERREKAWVMQTF